MHCLLNREVAEDMIQIPREIDLALKDTLTNAQHRMRHFADQH